MDTIQSIVTAVGLNSTIVPQFFIFFATFLALNFLVFKPYLAVYTERKTATVGNQEVADQIILESQDIQFKYESKAKELNSEIRTIFEASRKEAARLQEQVIYKAREDAEGIMKATREEIRTSVTKAKDQLKSSIPELAKTVSDRLIGNEVH